jgi:hypothetical protein
MENVYIPDIYNVRLATLPSSASCPLFILILGTAAWDVFYHFNWYLSISKSWLNAIKMQLNLASCTGRNCRKISEATVHANSDQLHTVCPVPLLAEFHLLRPPTIYPPPITLFLHPWPPTVMHGCKYRPEGIDWVIEDQAFLRFI